MKKLDLILDTDGAVLCAICVLTLKHRDGLTEQQCKDQIAAYLDECAMQVHLHSSV